MDTVFDIENVDINISESIILSAFKERYADLGIFDNLSTDQPFADYLKAALKYPEMKPEIRYMKSCSRLRKFLSNRLRTLVANHGDTFMECGSLHNICNYVSFLAETVVYRMTVASSADNNPNYSTGIKFVSLCLMLNVDTVSDVTPYRMLRVVPMTDEWRVKIDKITEIFVTWIEDSYYLVQETSDMPWINNLFKAIKSGGTFKGAKAPTPQRIKDMIDRHGYWEDVYDIIHAE